MFTVYNQVYMKKQNCHINEEKKSIEGEKL